MRRLGRVLLFVAGCWATGCSSERTEIVVVLDSDMSAPGEIDSIDVEVLDDSGALVGQQAISLTSSGSSLPGSFGVVRTGALGDGAAKGTLGFALEVPTDRMRIQASAALGATRQVTRTVELSFVDGETRRLDLFLASRCRSEQCSPGQTCTQDGCTDNQVDPNELPPWDG